MIVVVDTSVFVSAFIGPGGASRAVLRACLAGTLKPLMGTNLYLEYESLLSREQLFSRSPFSTREREEVLNAFMRVSRWTRIYFLWRPNLPDEADNHLVELAVAGTAEAIVTKNTGHFTRAELPFPGLRIVSPAGLAKELSQ